MRNKKMIYQEISNYQLDNYMRAVMELVEYHAEKLAANDLATFYKDLDAVLEDWDDLLFDDYGHMPYLLKNKLKEVYITFSDKQNKG